MFLSVTVSVSGGARMPPYLGLFTASLSKSVVLGSAMCHVTSYITLGLYSHFRWLESSFLSR